MKINQVYLWFNNFHVVAFRFGGLPRVRVRVNLWLLHVFLLGLGTFLCCLLGLLLFLQQSLSLPSAVNEDIFGEKKKK